MNSSFSSIYPELNTGNRFLTHFTPNKLFWLKYETISLFYCWDSAQMSNNNFCQNPTQLKTTLKQLALELDTASRANFPNQPFVQHFYPNFQILEKLMPAHAQRAGFCPIFGLNYLDLREIHTSPRTKGWH